MATKYPGSWKYCATCAYWGGNRQVDFYGQWVTVDGSTAKGKCLCRTSGWTRMDKTATSSCSKYEPWAPVRK